MAATNDAFRRVVRDRDDWKRRALDAIQEAATLLGQRDEARTVTAEARAELDEWKRQASAARDLYLGHRELERQRDEARAERAACGAALHGALAELAELKVSWEACADVLEAENARLQAEEMLLAKLLADPNGAHDDVVDEVEAIMQRVLGTRKP